MLKILSCIIGYGIWSTLSSLHSHTAVFQAPICFYNEGANKHIEAPDYITIQVQSKKEILKSIDTKNIAVHIDAQSLHNGPNLLTVNHATLFLPQSVNVVHCNPANIVITVKEKQVNESA
jgi:hypothetical protein